MSAQRSPETGWTRGKSLYICALVYIGAAIVAVGAVRLVRGSGPLVQAGVADLAATLFVFFSSRALRNSSAYDPYWSVVPPLLALYWLWPAGFTVPEIAMIAVVLWWAARLTFNWVLRWRGFGDEDWRYGELKAGAGRWEFFVDLFGIQLFPTVLVFLGCLPIFALGRWGAEAAAALWVGVFVAAAAILIETVADRQLRAFLARPAQGREHENAILTDGLWGVVRHPNYLGEILFWWGVWLIGSFGGTFVWWTLAGPVSITVLFAGVSVPMMDRHLRRRAADYAEHEASTAALLPGIY